MFLGGWVDASKSGFKDCLQQSKNQKNGMVPRLWQDCFETVDNINHGTYRGGHSWRKIGTIPLNLVQACKSKLDPEKYVKGFQLGRAANKTQRFLFPQNGVRVFHAQQILNKHTKIFIYFADTSTVFWDGNVLVRTIYHV
jgi:hypothetical protein